MNSFVVLGTDTDAGKTTFCLLWMAAAGATYAYWKPLESGASDSAQIRDLIPDADVLPSIAHFEDAVAPSLAARRAGKTIPPAVELARMKPQITRPLLIESFGSPFSPLNETELQHSFLQALGMSACLVTSSSVGAIGRVLQVLAGLRSTAIAVRAVVLMGPADPYAVDQIRLHASQAQVISLQLPAAWTTEAIQSSASEQREALDAIGRAMATSPNAAKSSVSEWTMRDRKALWHPYTSLEDPIAPLPVVAAEAEFLELADGRKIIDAISSWWTTLHGHRYPPLMEALAQATRRWDHVLFAGVTHSPAIELAELLLQSSPWPDGRVFYSDDGSTAVEVALKLAYQYWRHRGQPGRTLFVSFENGYHGDTFGAMSVGRDPVFFGPFEPLLFRALQIPVSAQRLNEILSEQGDKIAGVILEPLVQGAGGMCMHSPGELKEIHNVIRRHDLLMIVDEVMTGGGRTGTLWAHQQAGISPDLICAAKTLTGGMMPLAATIVSPKIVAAFSTPDRTRTFFHGHSYTAHPLACAVAAVNWRILLQGAWQNHARRIENHWRQWAAQVRRGPAVVDVRICGTILALELADSGGYLSKLGPGMREFAVSRGVLLRPLGNVVYAMPPLETSNASLHRITQTLDELLEHLKNESGRSSIGSDYPPTS